MRGAKGTLTSVILYRTHNTHTVMMIMRYRQEEMERYAQPLYLSTHTCGSFRVWAGGRRERGSSFDDDVF